MNPEIEKVTRNDIETYVACSSVVFMNCNDLDGGGCFFCLIIRSCSTYFESHGVNDIVGGKLGDFVKSFEFEKISVIENNNDLIIDIVKPCDCENFLVAVNLIVLMKYFILENLIDFENIIDL